MVRKLTLAVIGLRLPTLLSVDFGAHKDFGYGTAMFFFAKTGYGGGPASPNFDRRARRGLSLPDDSAVELPFNPKGRGSHGFKALDRNFPQNTIANEHWGHSTFRYDLRLSELRRQQCDRRARRRHYRTGMVLRRRRRLTRVVELRTTAHPLRAAVPEN